MATIRSNALRAGGACVRCRKGKTKCYYETGDPPCRNCEKGGHECVLPGVTGREVDGSSPNPKVVPSSHRPRDSLPANADRQPAGTAAARPPTNVDKVTPDMLQECERVISKTFPACVAFHKPSFVQKLKANQLEPSLVFGLLTCAARISPSLARRFGGLATSAADSFAAKSLALINSNIDQPSLADIQALCLVVIHEWGSRNAVRAYIYLGQVTRMLQMYRILNNGYLKSLETDRFNSDESLRRTVWLIYILDCMLTAMPERTAALSPRLYDDLALPCPDLNFAFGNAVVVRTLSGELPKDTPEGAQPSEVGEFGCIVLATNIWRDVVQYLGTVKTPDFDEQVCMRLLGSIKALRDSLPVQYIDKPQQINLHIAMGSGFTYAMIHSLLHCSTIFVQRRILLQYACADNFSMNAWKGSQLCQELVQGILKSSHTILSLINALESGSDKDTTTCYPIFMLFATFTASATTAYLSLKGLAPPPSSDMVSSDGFTMKEVVRVPSVESIVSDGVHFMEAGTELWPLVQSWHRHLWIMQRVLIKNDSSYQTVPRGPPVQAYKEASPKRESSHEMADYDQVTTAMNAVQSVSRAHSEARADGELPVAIPRRPGVTTINGGGVSTPDTASPPPYSEHKAADPMAQQRIPLPGAGVNGTNGTNGVGSGPSMPQTNGGGNAASSPDAGGAMQDMTASELCSAFENQLLELDDLAAFMGGGV